MTQQSKFTNFSVARRVRGLNRIAQIILGVSAIIGLNILASQYFQRIDLTEERLYSLAPETHAYVRELREPVDIIITVPEKPDDANARRVHRDLRRLLREYTYASRRDGGQEMVRVEFVDIYQQRSRAAELANLYDITDERTIIVASGGRTRQIGLDELYQAQDGDVSGFRGERAFTSAIVDVATQRRFNVYFLVGHGQMRLDDTDSTRGLSQLENHLRQRSINLASLDLSLVDSVPDNADLIVVASPQAAIMPEEQEMLRRYMNARNGRMIVLLDPGPRTGLDDLFYDWGILAEDMAIFDGGSSFRSSTGELLIRHLSEHPITNYMIEAQIPILWGQPRPIRTDMGAAIDDRIRVTQLLFSSPDSWAERDFRTERNPSFTEGRDIKGPVSIATVSERTAGSELGLNIPGGRLVVFGNSDFIANNRFDNFAGRTLFLNSLNWALDQTTRLNIPPRPHESYQVVLTEENMDRMTLYFAILPAAVGIFGFVVFMLRRR